MAFRRKRYGRSRRKYSAKRRTTRPMRIGYRF